MQLTSYDQARKRICAEYHQMPGMQLTVRQLERLSGTDRATCHVVLTELTRAGLLVRKAGDVYARGSAEPVARQMAVRR